MTHPNHSGGYYDDEGNWQRRKYCFRDCGERCTCKPPNGRYYSEAHDKRKNPDPPEAPR
jgi:hypothetical protein